MIAYLKTRLAILLNRVRRRNGPALRDRCAQVIMRMCAMQLERGETRELAPTRGATGPMTLSGGAITTIAYRVFDKEADSVDPSIKKEPWRAFAQVTMYLSIEKDPEFHVQIHSKKDTEVPDGHWVEVEPAGCHKAPGLALVNHLAEYFPMLPRVYVGPTYIPPGEIT